jgi:serine/threonine protein kinase
MKELALINCRLDGRYDVQRLLGRGSYAEIYVARDILASPQSPHSTVVIKALNVFMQNDLDADLERTLVENFQNEAIALDRVRHPNIISRLGHGSARDLNNTIFHYLVLEYLSGGDLAKMCRDEDLTLSRALYYLEQVCAGLGNAHKNNIIHRDVKPQNLLLTEDCKTVKIADFGVARVVQSDSPVTRVGTNIYAPPEHSPMLSGQTGTLTFTELTPAADVYSLAKSAYVLVTCESPRFYANQPISDLPEKFRTEPWAESFLKIIGKATQNDSRLRHQSVIEFWQDLSELKLFADAHDEIATQVTSRHTSAPQPHFAQGYTPLAPQKPRFQTSDLKPNLSVRAHPNLVVKLNNGQVNKFPAGIGSPQVTKGGSPVEIEETALKNEARQSKIKRKRSFFARFATFVLILASFAGVLYATHYYLRSRGILPDLKSVFFKPTGVASSDVNLRVNGDPDSQKIGLVPKNSKVRIVNSKDNWYEIDITEFSRPKENPTDAEHGWVFKKYIDVQE